MARQFRDRRRRRHGDVPSSDGPESRISLRARRLDAKRPAAATVSGVPGAGELGRRGRSDTGASVRCRSLAGVSSLAGLLALLVISAGCRGYSPPQKIDVRLAGAQIPVELVASWLADAREYDFRVEQVSPVYLSQHGFRHLRDGTCDVACTDRMITPREYAEFGDRELRGYRVGFYGYALYVHPDNPLDSIYAGHLGLLFQRKVRDWKELGPYEGPVRLIGPRKSTRGGAILMQQANIWFAEPTWEALESDAAIVDAVAADPLALGFASIGLDQGVRYLGLRMERTGLPAFPSLEEIESERYGLAKVIYAYVPAEPSPAAAAVIEYLLSPAGRAAMESTQVWPVPRERAEVPATR